MLELAVVLVSGLTNIGIGLLSYIKNPTSITNKIFALLCATWATWIGATYAAANIMSLQLQGMRFTMLCVVAMLLGFFLLIRVFPHRTYTIRPLDISVICVSILVGITVMTPLIFAGITVSSTGSVSPEPGVAIPVFVVYVIALIIMSFRQLIRKLHKQHSVAQVQLKYIFYSAVLFFTIIPVTNFVFPVLLQNSDLVVFSPVAPMVFAIGVAYAIIRRKLFDIQSAVARSTGYIVLLALLIALYAFLIICLSALLIPNKEIELLQVSIYTAAALLLVFTAMPLRNFVARITNRLFYRTVYDSQHLISSLNTVFLSNANINKLLKESADLIGMTLGSDFCIFGVESKSEKKRIIVGNIHREFEFLDIATAAAITSGLDYKIIIAEQTTSRELRQLMEKYGIAVLVRLTEYSRKDNPGIGYMMLGDKKSGTIYTKQDINVLGIIADSVTIAIQNALQFEEIQHFNETLQQKVDDATRKLRRSNTKLQNLDETKDEFISMASHQLRTPLTSVKGYLSMVLDGDAGQITETQRKLLNQAYVSSQRMVYTIADLLNVSRLKTGKFVIERSPVNLADIVQQEITSLAEAALAKDISLTFTPPQFCPPLMLDDTKIRQVIMNFIDNALYYTPTKGTITVTISATGKMLELKVVDTGMGVPTAAQPHMFTKFYRASNAQKARPDGTGLGLFMAKKIIIAQGGSLIFKSKEGKGSTFGFSFPLVRE